MRPPRKPDPAALKRQVDAWNARHPVGAPVAVIRDSGDAQETVTMSAAYVLSGHTAVVHLAGVRGCYDLRRVRPLSGGPPP